MKTILNFFFLGISILCLSCGDDPEFEGVDFKEEMRIFVKEISTYAKDINHDFIIIPQNGQELITEDGEQDGKPAEEYLSAIDGQGREDLFYGYDKDDKETSGEDNSYMKAYLDVALLNDVVVLVTDYCSNHDNMDDSYMQNNENNYISFAADERELNSIPAYPSKPYNENSDSVGSLDEIQNFLYLINPENYSTKSEFINAVTATNYDLIIMDYFFNEEEFTEDEVDMLKNKANGGKRLVISYMSIGEAENYRFYWDEGWKKGDPEFIYDENPRWEGNYKVKYWDEGWKEIIFGESSSYLDKIIDKGFNGVYLDIIDAFEYFEEM